MQVVGKLQEAWALQKDQVAKRKQAGEEDKLDEDSARPTKKPVRGSTPGAAEAKPVPVSPRAELPQVIPGPPEMLIIGGVAVPALLPDKYSSESSPAQGSYVDWTNTSLSPRPRLRDASNEFTTTVPTRVVKEKAGDKAESPKAASPSPMHVSISSPSQVKKKKTSSQSSVGGDTEPLSQTPSRTE